MIVGSIAAALAALSGVLALRRRSAVEARLSRLFSKRVRGRFARVLTTGGTSAKVACAAASALIAAAVAALLMIGPLPVPIAAYLGFIAPSVVGERRAAARRRAAERCVVTLVEWIHALVASGRPVDSAIAGIAARATGNRDMDVVLAHVRRDYTLGVPMHSALAVHGSAARIEGLIELSRRLDRSRELGRGALPLLQDLRDELRAAERARGLQAASHVDGKLTLVLTLCYLPALALLVIVPLFLTLLAGLFG